MAGNGNTVNTNTNTSNGITTVITLAVPSGKLVVADDLRPVYDWLHDEVDDYNSPRGQAQATEAMARRGCAYGWVGNSCPGLYQTGKGTYVIASPSYSFDLGDEVLPANWKLLASIITDLWAYSIADLADFELKSGNLKSLSWSVTSVDVNPGTYEFTHHTGEKNFNHDADTVIFADIRRVTER